MIAVSHGEQREKAFQWGIENVLRQKIRTAIVVTSRGYEMARETLINLTQT